MKKKKKTNKSVSKVKNRIFVQQKRVIELYERNNGNISKICKSVGISRFTYYDWLKKYPDFAEKIKAEEENLINFAESQLMVNISKGKEASLFFFLVNRKPERWKSITKVQMEHSGEVKTTPSVSIINVLNKKDEKTGRKIGEIIAEALGKKRE